MYYRLASSTYNKDDKSHEYNAIREVKEEEFNSFFEKQRVISSHLFHKHLNNMVIENGMQLDRYLNTLKTHAKEYDNKDSISIIFEGNRLILNFLNSFRVFIDHKNDEFLSSLQKDEYKEFISSIYDEEFEYRFFYKLRNYAIHYDLPFTDYTRNSQGHYLLLNREKLLKYDGWSSHIKKEIERLDVEFDISKYLQRFLVLVNTIGYHKMYYYAGMVINASKLASSYVQEAGGNFVFLVSNSIEDYKQKKISVTPFDLKELQESIKDLQRHPKIKINSQ